MLIFAPLLVGIGAFQRSLQLSKLKMTIMKLLFSSSSFKLRVSLEMVTLTTTTLTLVSMNGCKTKQ
jgi:hypothetical protein